MRERRRYDVTIEVAAYDEKHAVDLVQDPSGGEWAPLGENPRVRLLDDRIENDAEYRVAVEADDNGDIVKAVVVRFDAETMIVVGEAGCFTDIGHIIDNDFNSESGRLDAE